MCINEGSKKVYSHFISTNYMLAENYLVVHTVTQACTHYRH